MPPTKLYPSAPASGGGPRHSHGAMDSIGPLVVQALSLPFDTARTLHAAAARAGLIRKSILECRDFEKSLTALEQLTLGPWARHV